MAHVFVSLLKVYESRSRTLGIEVGPLNYRRLLPDRLFTAFSVDPESPRARPLEFPSLGLRLATRGRNPNASAQDSNRYLAAVWFAKEADRNRPKLIWERDLPFQKPQELPQRLQTSV